MALPGPGSGSREPPAEAEAEAAEEREAASALQAASEEEEAAAAGGARGLLRWDGFAAWLHCACVVGFDLELGQAVEVGGERGGSAGSPRAGHSRQAAPRPPGPGAAAHPPAAAPQGGPRRWRERFSRPLLSSRLLFVFLGFCFS